MASKLGLKAKRIHPASADTVTDKPDVGRPLFPYDPVAFGQRLRKLRLDARMTQEGLAAAARTSADAISTYENGRRNPKTENLDFLAAALGMTREKLLEGLPPQAEAVRGVAAGRRPPSVADLSAAQLTISPELRAHLLDACTAVEWPRDDLVDAYYASAPPEGRHDFDRDCAGDLVARMAVRLACALGQSDGAHPILRFVLRLRKLAAAPALQGALHDWFLDAAAHLGVDPDRQRALVQEIETAPPNTRELHLVVVIEPSDTARGRYAVRASRVLVRPGQPRWDDADAESLIVEDAPLCTLQEIPPLLMDLLLDIEDDLRRADNKLTLELVVPLDLLDCAADRWDLPRGIDDIVPLGVVHEVVVRSLERAYDPRCRNLIPCWEAKWKRLCIAGADATWVCGKDYAATPIAPRLHADGPARVVVGFAQPPSTDGVSPVLRDLINSGTPVAVWPRRTPDEIAFRACIEQLTAAAAPAWPGHIRRLRGEAHVDGGSAHPGHALSILWDNPHHLLPDARRDAARLKNSYIKRRSPT